MYQMLGIPRLIRAILYLNGIAAAALATHLVGILPNIPFVQSVSISVMAVSAVVSLIGESGLFPMLCRSIPFAHKLFPAIEGTYDVEISSNWSLIQAREQGQPLPQGDVTASLFRKSGTLTLKARLFTIAAHLEMADKYMTSDTVVATLKRSEDEPHATLSYIYRARVHQPETTDSSQHYGAARLDLPIQKIVMTIEGTYWTDRNWHRALNTAGRIRLTRKSRRRPQGWRGFLTPL